MEQRLIPFGTTKRGNPELVDSQLRFRETVGPRLLDWKRIKVRDGIIKARSGQARPSQNRWECWL